MHFSSGYKLIRICSSGMASQCEKCSDGTFLEKMNYFPNCFRCEKCTKPSKYETVSFSFHDFCNEIQIKYIQYIFCCVDFV